MTSMPQRVRSALPLLMAGAALVAAAWLAEGQASRQRAKQPAGALRRPSEVGGVPIHPDLRTYLLYLYRRITDDRVLALAAGIVFYGLLALFPAITAFVSSYALFADIQTIAGHLSLIEGIMPQGAFEIVRDQVVRVVSAGTGGLSVAFVLGLMVALWSANAGLKAAIDALNIIYRVKETRSFVRLNLVSLAMTLGTIVVLLMALGAVVVFPLTLAAVGWSMSETVASQLRWPALFVILLIGLSVLYRFGPDLKHPRWHWVSPGNVAAAVTWIAGSLALSWYLANVANYAATYGSLGAAIGLMMWMWVTSIVVLVGAEINVAGEHFAGDTSGAAVLAAAPPSELEARPGIEPG